VRRAVLVLLFMLVLRPALAADARDVFTVAAVPVDATAVNANAARDEARHDGERRAYQMLMDRLTLASDRARLPPPTQSLLNDLIAGYEVANERSSGVRYLADYSFRFRADAVRAFLRREGVAYCETPSKPVVVLALIEGGGRPLLWEDPNPWRDAWNAAKLARGLVPLVMPYGDLEDVQAIDADAALSGNPDKLAAVSQRYGGADVLVAAATLSAAVAPHTLAVSAKRYAAGGGAPPETFANTYAAAADESDTDLLASAVAGTAAQLDDAWKQANILDYSHIGTITVRVPTGTLERFIDVRDRLAQIPAVQRSELVALDREEAKVEIRYYGDPAQLRTALAQRDLALEGDAPDWVLERRTAAAAER
jgi:Uncharacterized protein conserved in bacteria (DUF2066)